MPYRLEYTHKKTWFAESLHGTNINMYTHALYALYITINALTQTYVTQKKAMCVLIWFDLQVQEYILNKSILFLVFIGVADLFYCENTLFT